MKRWYTIDFVFWNPETVSVNVQAESKEDAIKRAYEYDPWSGSDSDDFITSRGQETIYDCSTDTAIAGIARGQHSTVFDAPAAAQCAVPKEYWDDVWEPSGVDAVTWRRARIKHLEREITDIMDERAKKLLEAQA